MIHKYKSATIREAKIEDAFKLAAHLRTEDLIEIRSFDSKRPPYKALVDGLARSTDQRWAIDDLNGEVIAVFGVVPIIPDVGSVWLLGSGGIKKIQRDFIRHSKFWIDQLHKNHNMLCNQVYAENHVHINWLKWLGFTFIRKIDKHGDLGLPFYEFLKIKK